MFLTVSQSPILDELRAHIWFFLSGCENPVPLSNIQFEGGVVKTRKLVILDDVWTTQALDRLTFTIPGCTTLVVSRSKLTDPNSTYDVEVLTEVEAISLFCLCAFGQKTVPFGFCRNLVKQVSLMVSSPTDIHSLYIQKLFNSQSSNGFRLLVSVKVYLWLSKLRGLH